MKKLLLTFAIAGVVLVSSCGEDDSAPAIVPVAGTLTGGPFTFVVDGEPDFVTGIEVTGDIAGSSSSFIITDNENNILGTPGTLEMLEGVDFDGAGVGTCLIWHISYEGDLAGFIAGENTSDLEGSFEISNSITVIRGAIGATLGGGPFNFIVDGDADNIPEGGITVDAAGTDFGNSGWIVTDTELNILGLPGAFTGPDFDAAGSGVCQVWYISYEDGLTGLAVDGNVADLNGTFALSNAINVNRLDAPELVGGAFNFIVDGEVDNLAEGDITVEGGFALEGQSGWVVTDQATGDILGLPGSFTGPDFDGAGGGICNIYYITYAEGLEGLTGPTDGVPTSNINDLSGAVYELSNAIVINRLEAPTLTGGPFNFDVGDGIADMIPEGGITVDGGFALDGQSGWVVTDAATGAILGLPGAFTGPDFDGAGGGVCNIYYITYAEGLEGLTGPVDGVATGNINELSAAVYELSNAIEVNRTSVNSEMTLDISGLEDLGSDFAYEGWVIVDGSPVSTGVFTVDSEGNLSETAFEVLTTDLDAATMFVLSIEPVPDTDPAPAATKILSGAFSGSSATVSTGTVGEGFENATGNYIIATPTGTGAAEEEFSGIWFLDNSSGSAVAGLDLPTLNDGWKYEGWVVIDGTPVSTGTFTDVNAADESAPFSGTNAGPAYPGEDFLMNAPTGLTFPTDLRSQTAVISIEPSPDNSASPFTLKPLAGMIPATLSGPASLGNNVTASFPSGSVSR